ncbi:MAG TPA: FAD-dependent oxidoreductase [Jiangellaceae bacterium]|nr:FAD-dependent oxidoreductase [Jiangellaceae bacterium]
MSRVLVVGAGVIGLSCAIRLLERGHAVDVVARDLPPQTTSAVAAAIWYPYRAFPIDRVSGWSATAFDRFVRISERHPEAGVRMVEGSELHRSSRPDPWWIGAIPGLTRLTSTAPPYVDGWSFTTPIIEMPLYLGWLTARLLDAGGTLTRTELSRLPNAPDVVVNATGLAARHLVGDPTVTPVRGQVVYVEQVGLERWWLDERGPIYVVPRSHDIVVGGTDDEGSWDLTPDLGVARRIMARAAELVPELRRATVLGHNVGLRPARPQVRLEVERRGSSRIIHCYGHGGAGVTVSWGCAEEVADLADRTRA